MNGEKHQTFLENHYTMFFLSVKPYPHLVSLTGMSFLLADYAFLNGHNCKDVSE